MVGHMYYDGMVGHMYYGMVGHMYYDMSTTDCSPQVNS